MLSSRGSSQGSDPRVLYLLCWQVDSLPLVPPGKPRDPFSTSLSQVPRVRTQTYRLGGHCGTNVFCRQLKIWMPLYRHPVLGGLDRVARLGRAGSACVLACQHAGESFFQGEINVMNWGFREGLESEGWLLTTAATGLPAHRGWVLVHVLS